MAENERAIVEVGGRGEIESRAIGDLVGQVQIIQEVMAKLMKEDEHYGVIPGTSQKPSLLKPGAEKLAFAFRMVPTFEETTTDLPRDHREYQVRTILRNETTGRKLGEGLGSATTMETKWRFRTGPVEFTGQPIPPAYWQVRKDDPVGALAMIGGPGYVTKKNPDTGAWEVAIRGERVEHDNPADYYNTCLKMAKKRSFVDAVLTATAASDIFTQDIEEEDLAEKVREEQGARGSASREVKPEADATPDPAAAGTASSETIVKGPVQSAKTIREGKTKAGADFTLMEFRVGGVVLRTFDTTFQRALNGAAEAGLGVEVKFSRKTTTGRTGTEFVDNVIEDVLVPDAGDAGEEAGR